MATERMHYTRYYKDGTTSSTEYSHRSLPKRNDWYLETHYEENDGWSFQNRGPETKVCFIVSEAVSLVDAKQLIKNNNLNLEAQEQGFLEKMLEDCEKQGKYQLK